MDARLSSTPLETWAIAPTGEVRSRIGALASRLASGACVEFAAYGGSVVAGVGCCAGQRLACSAAEHQNCSFAARFVQQLRDDGACVTGRNLAVGASTTASSVGMLSHMPAGLAAPSLVMVDFSVNDIYDTAAARMVAATEVWLRVLLRLAPHVVPLLVETFPGLCSCAAASSADGCSPQHAQKEAIARHYGVPVLSYWRLVPGWYACKGRAGNASREPWWPRATAPDMRRPRPLNTPWAAYRHPFAPTHELIKDALTVAWRAWMRDAATADGASTDGGATPAAAPRRQEWHQLPPPLSDANALHRVGYCDAPSTSYGAASGMAPGVRTDGGWSHVEDVPGKPGFVSAGAAGSWLAFDLQFGAARANFYQLLYLQGYDINGTVRVEVLRAGGGGRPLHGATLHAARRDSERVTQAAVYTSERLAAPANATLVLNATLVGGNKFKFLSVLAC